jgi:hypothetical protein
VNSLTSEEVKLYPANEMVQRFGLSLVVGFDKLPYMELYHKEMNLIWLCGRLFPFSSEDKDYISLAASVAKGLYRRTFSGIYLEPGCFYARLMKRDDFESADSVSILFGFYLDPLKPGDAPNEVRISMSMRRFPSFDQLIWVPVDFWLSRLICAKLPIPWLKIPQNSPWTLEFKPDGRYENVKPIGVTFEQYRENMSMTRLAQPGGDDSSAGQNSREVV